MDSNLEARRPRWYRRRWGIALLTLAGALAIAVPVAWASDLFSDVPNTNPFHDDIGAIARAGVTKGCGTGVYCPSDNVTREAMAAFMHRGFSRVGTFAYSTTVNSASVVVGSDTITVGLPSGALSGAQGFLEAHAGVNIIGPSSGCPCEYWAALFDSTDNDYFNNFYSRVTVSNSEVAHMSVSGAVDTSIAGVHTIQLLAFRNSGTGTGALASGDATVSYHPFGATGTNVLGSSGPAASSADGRTP